MSKLSLRKKTLLIWLCLHFLILLLSYSSLELFNYYGDYEIKKIWPVVIYANYSNKFVTTRLLSNGVQEGYESKEKKMMNWYGIFVNYDFTEFITYSLLGIFIFRLTTKIRKRSWVPSPSLRVPTNHLLRLLTNSRNRAFKKMCVCIKECCYWSVLLMP